LHTRFVVDRTTLMVIGFKRLTITIHAFTRP